MIIIIISLSLYTYIYIYIERERYRYRCIPPGRLPHGLPGALEVERRCSDLATP